MIATYTDGILDTIQYTIDMLYMPMYIFIYVYIVYTHNFICQYHLVLY